MATIGSWWVKGFGARPGETVQESYYVNFLRPDARPLGGKLYVTNERLLFCPHLIDAAFGGSRTMIPLADIEGVDRIDPSEDDRDPDEDVGGGTATRLRVRRHNEDPAYFIVDRVTQAVAAIEEARAERSAD